MIDTHAHLTMNQFKKDLDAVIDRARKENVSRIITVGTDPDDCDRAVELANRHKDIHAVVGIHPHDSDGVTDEALAKIEAHAQNPKVVAIGEIGLDFYRDYAARDAQRRAFREQIRLARRVKLPVVIHSRDTSLEVLQILEKESADEVGGVLHCMPADPDLARRAEEMGFYLSIAGVVTYDKGARDGIIRSASPDRLLLETDCPYLTPVPLRGKRNEPAYVRYTLQRLAEILTMFPKEVDELTTRNAVRAFGLDRT
ncbi:MAG: TatD family hydrolase [Candidatus Eisenbacteria sp.]|nr:TatD family hydrolase [Candidatus Eisenbacteria bacterium]